MAAGEPAPDTDTDIGTDTGADSDRRRAVELANKAIVRRIYERGYTLGEEDVFPASYADDFLHHGKTSDDPPISGAAGQIASMLRFRQVMPDVRFDVHDQVAEGDMVATRIVITGTPRERFGPVEPTGELQRIHAMVLFRLRDGLAVEEWFFTDPLG